MSTADPKDTEAITASMSFSSASPRYHAYTDTGTEPHTYGEYIDRSNANSIQDNSNTDWTVARDNTANPRDYTITPWRPDRQREQTAAEEQYAPYQVPYIAPNVPSRVEELILEELKAIRKLLGESKTPIIIRDEAI